MANKEKLIKLLELYSGIGGVRFALECSEIPYKIIAAADVNPVVNCVYCHNFGKLNHFQRNIQSFTAAELDRMSIDIITMSPPCQPFTRVGLKKDVDDARACSFLHILNVIVEMQNKPSYFLLENVKGFEDSVAHDVLIETLENCNYIFQEFLLSPAYFGIPNSRLRYYIIAVLKPLNFSFPVSKEILCEMPLPLYSWKFKCEECMKNEEMVVKCQIKHFLEHESEEYFYPYLVPDNILLKYATVFDIVYESSCHSCCFTKAYGRYSLGTGSVYTPCNSSEVSSVFEAASSVSDERERLELLKKLRLRYFTPREVANLMCFPKRFNFPPNFNDKQKYKALGNSINVFVVSSLLKLLFEG